MEAIRSSETSVDIQTTRLYNPEDGSIHNYRCENLKSYLMILLFEEIRSYLLTVAFSKP
jgi:hypothetical protein